jgi:hypothetical protein
MIPLKDFLSPPTSPEPLKLGFISRSKATGAKYEAAVLTALADGPKTTIELFRACCCGHRTSMLVTLRALEKRGLIKEYDRAFSSNPRAKRPSIFWSLP